MKTACILGIFLVISYLSFAQHQKLSSDINQYLQTLPTEIKISMSVESLNGKKLFSLNENAKVPSASVIKIPILIELAEQVKSKKVSLDEEYWLQESDKVGGSGNLAELPAGKPLTIRYLSQEMIRVSDNTATNILIRKLGMESVNRRLEKLGAKTTRLNRIMMDLEAVKQGRQNWINTLEINDLLRKIYQKKVATPTLCQYMLETLKNCKDTTAIPHYLPKNLPIAHKTGTLDYVRGDAAIVYTPKPFIISVFVEKFSNLEQADEIIGRIAEITYRNLDK